MKRNILLLLSLLALTAQAQTSLRATLTSGRSVTVPIDSISRISIEPVVPAALQQMTGSWLLVASASGGSGAGGVYTATTDTIAFTAQVASDGLGLVCTAPRLFLRSATGCPATWRVLVEQNEAGNVRLGWVLDQQQPVSTQEFLEDPSHYLEQGVFYWGPSSHHPGGDTGHRYVYLLSENIETHALEGMTLWSQWNSEPGSVAFSFPAIQQVYAVVAQDIPYSYYNYSDVGYVDIWATPRFVRP